MRKKILLIHREPKTGKRLFDFLYQLGYQVKICKDSRFAVKLALDFEPNLIVCEFVHSAVHSQAFVKQFKDSDALSSIPFIMMIPRDDTQIQSNLQVDDVLLVPFDQTELYGLVTEWIESGRKPEPPSKTNKKKKSDFAHKDGKSSSKTIPVDCRSLAEAMWLIASKRRTGVLKVRGKKRRVNIAIKSGEIVAISSNYIHEDSFGHFLVKTDNITKKEQKVLFERAKANNLKLGEMLVKQDIFTKGEIANLLGRHKALKVLRLFTGSWDDTFFRFEVKKRVEVDSEMEPMSVVSVLKEGILNAAPGTKLIKRFLTTLDNNSIVKHARNFEHTIDFLDLDTNDLELAEQLNGISLNEVGERFSTQFNHVFRLLFLLMIFKATKIKGSKKQQESTLEIEKGKTSEGCSEQVQSKKSRMKRFSGRSPRKKSAAVKKIRSKTKDKITFNQALGLARDYIENREFAIAKKLLEKLIKIDSSSPEALALLGWVRFKVNKKTANQIEECKKMMEKALTNTETAAIGHLYLGKIYKYENNESRATKEITKAHSLDPDHPEILREIQLIDIKRRKDKSY